MNSFFILFGLPGSGKSFVGEILKTKFSFTLFNGDDCLPQDMKQALFKRQPISKAMRQRFYQAILTKIDKLVKTHQKLVFMQTFLTDALRRQILVQYPEVKFLLVTTDPQLRESRYLNRPDFNLGLDYLRQMCDLFEPPTIPYIQINNNHPGEKSIIQQLVMTRSLTRLWPDSPWKKTWQIFKCILR